MKIHFKQSIKNNYVCTSNRVKPFTEVAIFLHLVRALLYMTYSSFQAKTYFVHYWGKPKVTLFFVTLFVSWVHSEPRCHAEAGNEIVLTIT